MSVSTTPDDARPRQSARHAERGAAVVGAAVGLFAVVVVTLATGWGWAGIAASAALVPASMAAAVDVRSNRLPDLLVALCAAVGVFVAVVVRGGSGLLIGVVGAACVALPLVAAHLVAPSSMGFGDVKLAGALGVSVGAISPDVGAVLLISLVTLAVASAVGLATAFVLRRRDVAFGPALVAGTAVALISAEQLGGTPLSWQ